MTECAAGTTCNSCKRKRGVVVAAAVRNEVKCPANNHQVVYSLRSIKPQTSAPRVTGFRFSKEPTESMPLPGADLRPLLPQYRVDVSCGHSRAETDPLLPDFSSQILMCVLLRSVARSAQTRGETGIQVTDSTGFHCDILSLTSASYSSAYCDSPTLMPVLSGPNVFCTLSC